MEEDKGRRIGGLVLEMKGGFYRTVNEILDRDGGTKDFIEVSLDSEYRYNPLHNDLDTYALLVGTPRRAVQSRVDVDGQMDPLFVGPRL